MTKDAATLSLRAHLAREILAWMDDAFASVDFEAPSDKVVEGLTLAWSGVVLRVEAIDHAAATTARS